MGSHQTPLYLSQIFPGLAVSQILFWLAILALIAIPLGFALSWVLAFDFAKAIVSTIQNVFQEIKNVLTPPKDKWDSWQVLIWISAFSWVMSLLPSSDVIRSLIATVGWLFLIPGVHWFMHEEKLKAAPNLELNVKKALTINNFYLAPWITGALVCIFIYGSLTNGQYRLAWVSWPPISTAIAVAPKFIKLGPKFAVPEKADDRQQIIILMLSNLLLSCWIGLYFSTQSWFEQYPSILSGDLSRSSVVLDFNPRDKPPSRGATLLDRASEIIDADLEGRSWSEVEKWLFELDQRMPEVEREVFDSFPDLEEDQLWQITGRTAPGVEYALQLFAVWQGPTSDGQDFYLTKTCLITKKPTNRVKPGDNSTSPAQVGIAQVDCGVARGPYPGAPNYAQIQIDPNVVPTQPNTVPVQPDVVPPQPAQPSPSPTIDPNSKDGNKRW